MRGESAERGREAGLIFTPFVWAPRRVIYAHALHLIVMGIEQCHRVRGGRGGGGVSCFIIYSLESLPPLLHASALIVIERYK